MKFPAYPKYKSSGVEWLGEVPEQWEVVPLGYLVRFSGGSTPDKTNASYWEGTIPWVSPKDMKVARIDDAEDHISQQALDDGSLRLLPLDSVLIVVRGMILAHSFPVAITTTPVTINQDMKAVTCGKRVTASFLSWSFTGLAKIFVSFADESAHGTRKLETGTLTRFPFLLPPLSVQDAIATHLDRETARLDRLVAKKRELIERLKEKRTALISRTVTRGLPPDATRAAGLPENPTLKPSGIDWLGAIPMHWSFPPVRWVTKAGATITYGIVQAGPDVEDGIPYIRTSDMAGDSLPEAGYLRTSPEIDASYARSKVKPNDLVVAIRATLGKGLLVPEFLDGANLTQGTAKISPGEKLLPRFLLYTFNSEYCQTSIRNVAKGATFLEITLEALRKIRIAIPPLPEQAAIVAYLDFNTAKLDALIAKIEDAIERLHEYRTALITAAVTGKIDVRGAVP